MPSQPVNPHREIAAVGALDSGSRREGHGSPASLLETIARAIEAKSSAGARAYLQAFSDPSSGLGERLFRAIYDPGVKAGWEASSGFPAPEPWDIAHERSLPRELNEIRPLSTYHFSWQVEPGQGTEPFLEREEFGADTAEVHRRYLLVAVAPTAPAGAAGDTIAIGSCELSLERARGRWTIYRWTDHVDPSVGVNPSSDARPFSFWRLESLSL
jgi:hypothetical protein